MPAVVSGTTLQALDESGLGAPVLPAPPARARILLFEEYPLVRKGLADLINRQPDMELCGVSDGIGDARHWLETHQPDLVILGTIPQSDLVLDLIRYAKAQSPEPRILVFALQPDRVLAHAALQAGAEGFVVRDEPVLNLLEAARQVLAGEIYVSEQIQSRAVSSSAIRGRITDPRHVLTEREQQVFRLLGQGLASAQIAQELGISVRTVATHRTRIKAKLHFASLAELEKNARHSERLCL